MAVTVPSIMSLYNNIQWQEERLEFLHASLSVRETSLSQKPQTDASLCLVG